VRTAPYLLLLLLWRRRRLLHHVLLPVPPPFFLSHCPDGAVLVLDWPCIRCCAGLRLWLLYAEPCLNGFLVTPLCAQLSQPCLTALRLCCCAHLKPNPAGTFGEAFKAGGVVLKIVPMEGSCLVNGEPQKRADEILAEVSVTLTLSRLNGAAAAPGALCVCVCGCGRGTGALVACVNWHCGSEVEDGR
jgi:hypothetical protein